MDICLMSGWDDYSAKKRCLQLRLPGNACVVHAESAEIIEGVNRLFRADVVFTGNTVFEPKKLIGSHAEAEFMFPLTGHKEAVRRHFSGVITDLQFLSEENRGYTHCRITLEPDLWRLAQSSDRRIWRRMSAVDVVETLLKEHNLPSAMFRLQGQPPVVEYSVQYGETDLHYMIRRLEAAGLFWWFFHEKGQHKLCVGDGSSSWATATEWADATAHFCLVDKEPGQNYIHRWQKSFSYVPHARTGGGWNFEMPDAAVKARVPSLIQYTESVKKELFTYPSGAQTQEEAQRLETQRLQIDEARYCTVHAQSTVHVLAPARVFTPKFPQGGQLPDHVITTITHHISAVAPVSGEETSAYHNSFTAIPATVALLPEQKHKAPSIASTQTAIVAGPENEQIHCDKYGRVKLWFPWDRRAKKDGSDTDWIRTSQIWGGQDYGAQIVPRVGTEVLVSFLEGHPDHPIVTGTVVNPKTMPAYTLPDTKSRLTLRSQTYKGKGFNEISLEDADEKENFFMSAQKERTEVVGGSGLKRVVKHQIDYIGGNHASSVNGNSKIETKGSVHIAVGHSGEDVKNAFNNHSGLNNKTVNLLLQGAGLASGTAGDGLRTLAKAIDNKKLGFWSQEALGTQGEFLKSEAGLDAGSKLAEHGTKLAEDVSDAFQDSGEHHTIISRLRSSIVGGASVDQIAGGKVVNIGGVCLHHTAQEHLTTAGQKLTMLSGDATVIESKKIEIFADDNIRLSTPGGYIELTKSGITLHGLKIDIQGNHVDFQQGGAGKGTRKPFPES